MDVADVKNVANVIDVLYLTRLSLTIIRADNGPPHHSLYVQVRSVFLETDAF